MANWTYDEALRRLLAHEGGYSNHPSDPGGPTNFGITVNDYRKYIDAGGTAADVRRMSVGQAKAIYQSKYWNVLCCDQLPAGVDYAVFDYGVNSGTGRASKVFKRVLGIATSDSVIGPAMIAAAKRRDAKSVVNAICDERLRFLKSLRTWPVFGAGWERRVREVRAAAVAMAARTRAASAEAATDVRSTPGRGEIPENRAAKQAVRMGVPTVTAVTGYGFWEWVAAHPKTSVVIVLLIVAAMALGFNRLKQQHKKKQETPAPDTPAVPELTKA